MPRTRADIIGNVDLDVSRAQRRLDQLEAQLRGLGRGQNVRQDRRDDIARQAARVSEARQEIVRYQQEVRRLRQLEVDRFSRGLETLRERTERAGEEAREARLEYERLFVLSRQQGGLRPDRDRQLAPDQIATGLRAGRGTADRRLAEQQASFVTEGELRRAQQRAEELTQQYDRLEAAVRRVGRAHQRAAGQQDLGLEAARVTTVATERQADAARQQAAAVRRAAQATEQQATAARDAARATLILGDATRSAAENAERQARAAREARAAQAGAGRSLILIADAEREAAQAAERRARAAERAARRERNIALFRREQARREAREQARREAISAGLRERRRVISDVAGPSQIGTLRPQLAEALADATRDAERATQRLTAAQRLQLRQQEAIADASRRRRQDQQEIANAVNRVTAALQAQLGTQRAAGNAQEQAARAAREAASAQERSAESLRESRRETERNTASADRLEAQWEQINRDVAFYRRRLQQANDIRNTIPARSTSAESEQFRRIADNLERQAAARREVIEATARQFAAESSLESVRRNHLRNLERELGITVDLQAAKLRERAATLLLAQAQRRLNERRRDQATRQLPPRPVVSTETRDTLRTEAAAQRAVRALNDVRDLQQRINVLQRTGGGQQVAVLQRSLEARRREIRALARQLALTRRLTDEQRQLLGRLGGALGGGGGLFGGATAGAGGFSAALSGLSRRLIPFLTLLYGLRSAGFAVERVFRLMERAGRGIARIVTTSAEFGAEIFSMSRNLRFAIPELLAARQAFEGIGLSVEDASDAIAEIQEQIGRALTGTRRTQRQARHLFEQLGLDRASLSQLAPQQAFNEVIARLATLDSAFERYQVGAQLLGEANAEIVGQANELADALQRAEDRLTGFGVPAEEQFYAARRLREEFSGLSQNLRNTGVLIANRLAPAIVAGIQRFYAWAGSSRELAERFTRLVRVFADFSFVAIQLARAAAAAVNAFILLNTVGARLAGARWAEDLLGVSRDLQRGLGEASRAVDDFRNLDDLSIDFGDVPAQLADIGRLSDGYAELLLRGREARREAATSSINAARSERIAAEDRLALLNNEVGVVQLAGREVQRAAALRVEAINDEIASLERRIEVLREAGQFDQTFTLADNIGVLEGERDAILGQRTAIIEVRRELQVLRREQAAAQGRADTADLIGDFSGVDAAVADVERLGQAVARLEARERGLERADISIPNVREQVELERDRQRIAEVAEAAELRRRLTITETGNAIAQQRQEVAGLRDELSRIGADRDFEQSISGLPDAVQEVVRQERQFEQQIQTTRQALLDREADLRRQVTELHGIGDTEGALNLVPQWVAAREAVREFTAEVGSIRPELRAAFDAAESAAYDQVIRDWWREAREFNNELRRLDHESLFRTAEALRRVLTESQTPQALLNAYEQLQRSAEAAVRSAQSQLDIARQLGEDTTGRTRNCGGRRTR